MTAPGSGWDQPRVLVKTIMKLWLPHETGSTCLSEQLLASEAAFCYVQRVTDWENLKYIIKANFINIGLLRCVGII